MVVKNVDDRVRASASLTLPIQGMAWESAFLLILKVILIPSARVPHFEKHFCR